MKIQQSMFIQSQMKSNVEKNFMNKQELKQKKLELYIMSNNSKHINNYKIS